MSQKVISARTTALLDFLRALAAVYVVLHHVAVHRGWDHGAGMIFRFGQEAVVVFFLLSGFVIFANEYHRATIGFGYFYRRIRRIYPCLLVAMAVSTGVAYWDGSLASGFSLRELIGSLLAAQDISALKPGVIVDPYLGNDPLWSLSYEIIFYLIFPLALSAWKRWPSETTWIVGIVSTLSYVGFAAMPNHVLLVLAYYQVWWCGAMCAQAYLSGARTPLELKLPISWLIVLCAVAGIVTWIQGYRGLGIHPFLEFRHFVVSLVFILVGFGPIGRILGSLSQRIEMPMKAVAGISYGLYVLHYPLLVRSSYSESVLGLIVMTFVLIAVSFFADAYLNRHLPKWRAPGMLPGAKPNA